MWKCSTIICSLLSSDVLLAWLRKYLYPEITLQMQVFQTNRRCQVLESNIRFITCKCIDISFLVSFCCHHCTVIPPPKSTHSNHPLTVRMHKAQSPAQQLCFSGAHWLLTHCIIFQWGLVPTSTGSIAIKITKIYFPDLSIELCITMKL